MIRPSNIHSVTTFTRNAKKLIQQVKETKEPIALTVNGQSEVVIQDAREYQILRDSYDSLVKQSIERGLADIEAGRVYSLEEVMTEVDQIIDAHR